MVHNYLKTNMQNVTFTQLHAECILMFGSRIRNSNGSASAWAIQSSLLDKLFQEENQNQVKKDKRKKKIKAQAEMIAQQVCEIQNLKVEAATGMDAERNEWKSCHKLWLECTWMQSKRQQ